MIKLIKHISYGLLITYQMVEITGYYADLTRSIRLIHGEVTEVLFAATANCLVGIQDTKDGKVTDSCFALSGAHQYVVLMINAVCLLENWGGITGGRK